jgi:hypothetical protein
VESVAGRAARVPGNARGLCTRTHEHTDTSIHPYIHTSTTSLHGTHHLQMYFEELHGVATKLLEGVALSLGAERDYFAADFDKHTSFLRLNHYPPCPNPESNMAVHHHTDAGGLTVHFLLPCSYFSSCVLTRSFLFAHSHLVHAQGPNRC